MIRRSFVAAALALGIVSGSLASPWNAGPGVIFTPVTTIARTVWTTGSTYLSNGVRTMWTEEEGAIL